MASVGAGLIAILFLYLAAPFFQARTGDFAPNLARRVGVAADGTTPLAVGLVILLVAAVGWGLLYTLVRAAVPGPFWAVGLGYGFTIWLVGRYVILPALNISPTPGSMGLSLADHLVFGFALSWMSRTARDRAAT